MDMMHAHGHALDVASPFPGTETEKVGAHIAKTTMSFLFLFGEVDTGNSKTRILGAWPMDMVHGNGASTCLGPGLSVSVAINTEEVSAPALGTLRFYCFLWLVQLKQGVIREARGVFNFASSEGPRRLFR